VSSEEYDAIVVGSGAGGGFAAMGLAEAGLRVLLLERGRRYLPNEFPMAHSDWESRPQVLRSAEAQPFSIFAGLGAELDVRWRHLHTRSLLSKPPGYLKVRGPFDYQRVVGLGGSTLHYDGEAHRFADFAFRSASTYGFGVDWPLDYPALEPWYARAEQVLGVAGVPGNPFKPARGPYPTPAHPFNPATQRVADAASRLGWAMLPNPLALPTRPVDGRSACQRSGGCNLGGAYGAKSSTDRTALVRAERSGRLTILTGARVVQLLKARDGRVDGVVFRRAGEAHRASARAYVLGLGAVETPRLLLASELGNASGMVGRYFMELVFASLTVRFDRPLDPYVGPPIQARSWDFARPAADGPNRGGFVLGISGTASGHHGPASYAMSIPGIGRAHKHAMREKFGTVASLFAIAEHEPRRGNRLVLDERLDEDDVPLVRVESAYSETDCRTLEAMIARLEDLALASGAAERLHLLTTYARGSSTHVGGGCRMGSDPAESVVDPWGRAHEVPNLFVADASVLPGQGAGDSPSLTIQALALRTADRIAQAMRRRDI